MADQETKVLRPVGQDEEIKLNDTDLLLHVGKIVQQIDQHYLKGEIEVTVLMSFKGRRGNVAVATNITEPERLRYHLDKAKAQIPDFDLRSKKGRLIL
jgi:hypothetical protein